MDYRSGEKIHAGDEIRYAGGVRGTVVFVIEHDEYLPGYPREEWSYLERGFMVREEDGTLIHYLASDDLIELVSRMSPGCGTHAGARK